MKTLLIALSAAGILLAGAPSDTEARQLNFKGSVKQPLFKRNRFRRPSRLGRTNRSPAVRSFRQRRFHRTPSHFTHRGVPYWAAKAFQPARDR